MVYQIPYYFFQRKTSKDFEIFVKALKEAGFDHLAERLHNKQKKDKEGK